MILTLYVKDNCTSCNSVKKQISSLIRNKNFVKLRIKNIDFRPVPGIIIVPALFIDEELYSYREIDENKLKIELDKYR